MVSACFKVNYNLNHVIVIFLFVITIIVRILGHRVAELEKKLKTLEVSGLWSLQGLYQVVNINFISTSLIIAVIYAAIYKQL